MTQQQQLLKHPLGSVILNSMKLGRCSYSWVATTGMRITLLDTRQLVGRFMAFDKHMNVVLGDCEEFRYLPPKKSKDEDEVGFLFP